MRTRFGIIAAAVLFGLLAWVAAALADYLFFSAGAFREALAAGVPARELVARLLVLVLFALFGAAAARRLAGSEKAAETLRRSEENYRSIYDSANDAIFIHDAETGRILDVNSKTEEMFGYRADELRRLTVHDLSAGVHPYTQDEAVRWVRKAAEEGPQIFEWKSRHRSGRIFWAEVNLKRALISGQYRILAIVRDITVRKRAEERIRESEARTNGILRAAPAAIGLVKNRVFQWVSGQMVEMTGYSRKELIGRSARLLYESEGEFERVGAMKRDRLQRGSAEAVDTRWRRKDGSVIDIRLRHTAVNPADLSEGIIFTAVDVSEQKRVEEETLSREKAFREEIRELARFPAENPHPVMRVGRDGTILYSNEAGRKLMESCGVKPGGMVPEKMRGFIAGAAEAGKGVSREVPCGGKVFLFAITPIEGADYLNLYGFDITGRRKLEEQLLHAQKMEAIGTLAGGLAHDFNNILAGIMGYTSLLKKVFEGNREAIDDLDTIEKLAARGADLTRGLLTFSRRGEYNPEPLNVGWALNGVLKIIGRTMGKNITIDVEMDPEMPSITGDRGQFHQVMMNLCINACEAMPDGGTLAVKASRAEPGADFFLRHPELGKGEYVRITVSDTGRGISPDIRERIFEPFFTTKTESEGTGLGLAVVLGIVEKHRGCIEVESAPERGSSFALYFPASPREKPETGRVPRKAPGGDETILLVDDEAAVREGLGLSLESLGYTVIGASGGEEALEAYRKKKDSIDLAILDVAMPGMGGRRTYREMKAIRSDVPVIIATGYSLDSEARDLLREGAHDFIQKPFEITALAEKIRRVLRPPGRRRKSLGPRASRGRAMRGKSHA